MEPIREVADEDRERFKAVREDVHRKACSAYVREHLSMAEDELAYWRSNRDVILKIKIALEEGFLQEIDEAYFLRIGELLSRIDGRPVKNVDAKSYANIVRLKYERDGIFGIIDFARSQIDYYARGRDPLSNGIDETISRAEAEVGRIADIIEQNSPDDAVSRLLYSGDCHRIWAMEKKILKTEYGIDWKTPAETHPYIDFD